MPDAAEDCCRHRAHHCEACVSRRQAQYWETTTYEEWTCGRVGSLRYKGRSSVAPLPAFSFTLGSRSVIPRCSFPGRVRCASATPVSSLAQG